MPVTVDKWQVALFNVVFVVIRNSEPLTFTVGPAAGMVDVTPSEA